MGRPDPERPDPQTADLSEEELEQVAIIVSRRLRESRKKLLAEVKHYGRAEALLAQRPTQANRCKALRRQALAAVSECDREFVRALGATQGLGLDVAAATRTPGRELRLEISGPISVEQVERTLRPLLLNEKITVTARRLPARKQLER